MAAATAPAAPSGAEFDKLLSEVLENPQRVLDPNLSPEEVLALQRQLNPYSYAGGEGAEQERVAALSYTNLRADYLRRFTMTGLVGFVFRMLREWDAPAEARRWTSKVAAKREAAEQKARSAATYTAADLLARSEKLRELAHAAADAAKAAEAARSAAELANGDALAAEAAEAPAAERRRLNEEAAARLREADREIGRACGLQYAAAFEFRQTGRDCDARLDALAAEGRRYPEVREILDQFPLERAPPGQLEMPAEAARLLVKAFLRSIFEYDPDAHVRSAHDEFVLAPAVTQRDVPGLGAVPLDEADPSRLPLSVIVAAAPPPVSAEDAAALDALRAGPQAYNAAAYMLRHPAAAEALRTALAAPERFERYLFPVPEGSPARAAATVVPPQDTFHRWQFYMEANYEELRTATDAIYHERPDLDIALILYDTFEGDPEQTSAAFQAFSDLHQEDVMTDIRGVQFGAWTLLGDFKENREKINFYNRHTEVLKRILDRHAEDKKMGAELMRNRVRKVKAANIAEAGPDDPGLAAYTAQNLSNSAAAYGAERVLSREERLRLERTRGNLRAAKELEAIDAAQAEIRRLTALAKDAPLSEDGFRELQAAQAALVRAQEMIEVPDNAVAVDVWAPGADGKLGRSQFYSKSDSPEEVRSRAAGEVYVPPAAPASAMSAADGRPLAPFAQAHLEESMRLEAEQYAARREKELAAREKEKAGAA